VGRTPPRHQDGDTSPRTRAKERTDGTSNQAASRAGELSTRTFVVVCGLAVATMFPVTGVVPVLKGLVAERYQVGDFLVSTFMALNMLGALFAAPVCGWLSDRFGWTKRQLLVATAADAVLWLGIVWAPSFGMLAAFRFFEGAAHIAALSMLLTIVARSSSAYGKRSRMAAMGGSIIFGVAFGAPLGGILGAYGGATFPLLVGAAVMALVTALAAAAVPAGQIAPDPDAHPRWPKLYAPPNLRPAYLFGFVDRFTVGFFVVAFPLFAARNLALDSAATGKLIGMYMLPFALLSYPAGRLAERFGLWAFVLTGSLLFGLAFAAIPWTHAGSVAGSMVLCGVLSAVMFGPNLILVLSESRHETRSSAVAGFNTVGSLGFLLGPLAAGGLLELLAPRIGELASYRVTFGVGGLVEVLCVAGALAIAWVPRVWRHLSIAPATPQNTRPN
jgi:MFS family permease